ncbi:MAG TPA: diaminopimelate decarboxylase, partial [Segetibacter sp.]
MSEKLSKKQLINIATEFGTPVYVYHAEKIAEQYQKLKQAFKKSDSKFFYACKSLTNINILKWMKQIGASLDCVSIHEVTLGLKAGFEPQE